MKSITPHLWFDTQAKEAAEFYTTVIPNSKITNVMTLHNTPSGDCDVVNFDLAGQPFMAISAGPLFKFNPSISFHIKCNNKEEVDAIWAKLSDGGQVLMDIGAYPWSERYGWCQDKYGLSWQIIYVGDAPVTQKITPVIMYVGDMCGKTEEAVNMYVEVFKEAPNAGDTKTSVDFIQRYQAGQDPDQEGTVQYASFTLQNMVFGAMDSAREHNFTFTEAISFVIYCDNQEEIDYYWAKLSAVPESEQCGWLKDKFGVSWQVAPTAMDEMMANGSPEQIDRVTQAFLQMKKFDLTELSKAFEG